jgi:hypothetical protein
MRVGDGNMSPLNVKIICILISTGRLQFSIHVFMLAEPKLQKEIEETI